MSGQEQVYRSIQELTAGVQRGEVTAEAEIYHQRTERWLSIKSHPHYKMAAEGGATVTRTSTRTSRLKFTRPSTPAANTGVMPTPPAQKPDEGDLEELNRLLVLLDPLPTPAERAEPQSPASQPPVEPTLARPEPVAPSASDDPEPTFGTMLRLEDLEAPAADMPIEAQPTEIEPIHDVRIIEEAPVVEVVSTAPIEEFAPSDLGLPVEIHFDEGSLPVAPDPVEASAEPAPVFAPPAIDKAPVSEMALASVGDLHRAPVAEAEAELRPIAPVDVPPTASTARRIRPMLYVAAAAIIAAAIFAFTGRGNDPNQGMVTLASATASAAAISAPPESTTVAAPPTAAVGFPLPTTATKPEPKPDTPSTLQAAPEQQVSLLPTAPMMELGTDGTDQVTAAGSASKPGVGSGAALVRGYGRAYDNLQTDFSAQMDRTGLVRLFNQTQLTTADGLSGARRALESASAAVRQYRTRESAIERAYQDSARTMERSGASATDLRDWMTHLSQKESAETADESTRLIGQVDAVFALLQAQSGRYRIQGSEIRFDNPDAAARYSDLQSWITRRLEHWAGQPTSAVPVTVAPLLEGIGVTRLPVSR